MVFSSCLIFVPFLLHVPSGRLSGPTLNPVRCFFGRASPDSPSLGLFGAIVLLMFCIVDVVFFWGESSIKLIMLETQGSAPLAWI